MPSGSSLKTFIHYAQLINGQVFKRFDFGTAEDNLEKYGRDQPPAYDLSGITFSTSIFYGDVLDVFSTDGPQLSKQLETLFVHEYHQNHMSFMIGRDMKWLEKDLLNVINLENSKSCYTNY